MTTIVCHLTEGDRQSVIILLCLLLKTYVKINPCTAMPVIIQFQANYTDIVEFRGR